MGIFKKKTVKPVPEECRGMEIKIMSSTCTGEKTIGFYNRNTREIMYPELVKSDSDVEAFYEKYGLKNELCSMREYIKECKYLMNFEMKYM